MSQADKVAKLNRVKMATGALSHLIGAYYLLCGLACDCDPKQDESLRQLLLHLKGAYWVMVYKKFGIRNPRNPNLQTRELREEFIGQQER